MLPPPPPLHTHPDAYTKPEDPSPFWVPPGTAPDITFNALVAGQAVLVELFVLQHLHITYFFIQVVCVWGGGNSPGLLSFPLGGVGGVPCLRWFPSGAGGIPCQGCFPSGGAGGVPCQGCFPPGGGGEGPNM